MLEHQSRIKLKGLYHFAFPHDIAVGFWSLASPNICGISCSFTFHAQASVFLLYQNGINPTIRSVTNTSVIYFES